MVSAVSSKDVKTCKLEYRERSIWEPSAWESSRSHELEKITLVNINKEFKGLTGAVGGSWCVQRFPFRWGGGVVVKQADEERTVSGDKERRAALEAQGNAPSAVLN